MNATLYTGNGSTQTITNGVAGQAFQPDLIWIKARSAIKSHCITDSVRGTNLQLTSNSTGADQSTTDGITAFNTNGFNLGAGVQQYSSNDNGTTYVGWQWKAGGTAVSNTSGTITSSVSANTTSGFSVVTYTGTGSAATIGHGLGVAPDMVIVKYRDGADNWEVLQKYMSASPASSRLRLNQTTAVVTGDTTKWNGVMPTSTVFSVGSDPATGGTTGKYVAYCWAPIAGYSAFGSYTGNGSADGPFVYTGFRPAFIMLRRTDSATDWFIEDNKRLGYNVDNNDLIPNSSVAEQTDDRLDFTSNGFKLRSTFSSTNASGGTYIYMAFAENPFKYANAR
jgi:hypothetical protein